MSDSPLTSIRSFIASIKEEERKDFVMRLVWQESTVETFHDVITDKRSAMEMYDTAFPDVGEDPFAFSGMALKLRAYIDFALDAYSEASQERHHEFLRLADEKGIQGAAGMKANFDARCAYYRGLMPNWEHLKTREISNESIRRLSQLLHSEMARAGSKDD